MPLTIPEIDDPKRLTKHRVLFVTGTDTGVGKTVLSVLLVRHFHRLALNVVALKPIASGGRGDALALHEAQQRTVQLDQINPWHYRRSLAPPLAAREEGCCIRQSPVVEHLRACQRQHRLLIVEGAGGLLSPLGEGFDSRDLIVALRATPIVVAPNRLGAVHQVRAALSALPKAVRRRTIVVLSNPPHPNTATLKNADLLREFEPGIHLLTLPWLPRWQERSAPPVRATRNCMEELSRLLGIPSGNQKTRSHSDGPWR